MTMNELAQHIIAVDNKNDVVITNLKLQKVMYFLLKKLANEPSIDDPSIEKIYDMPFLVWRYGPVVESIYEKYKSFGSAPIVESFEENTDFSSLNDEILDLSRKNVFDLVSESHKDPFWKKHEADIKGWRSNVAYSVDDLKGKDVKTAGN